MESDLQQKYQSLQTSYMSLNKNFSELLSVYQEVLTSKNILERQVHSLTIENNLLKERTIESDFSTTHSVYAKTICANSCPPTIKKITQTVNTEQPKNSSFEAFLIVGTDPNTIQTGENRLKIEWEYPRGAKAMSESIRAVLPDFCFPNGSKPRKLRLSGSASELNSLLYGQEASNRTSNYFVFTLKSEQTEDPFEFSEMPNYYKTILYVVCIQTEDLVSLEGSGDWIVQKCHCLLSYLPTFEFHYEILGSLLSLRRLYRMEKIQNDEIEEIGKIPTISVTPDEISLLNRYFSLPALSPGVKLKISPSKLNSISFKCPIDLSAVDVVWNCCPLLTRLNFTDLLWLLSAAMQEKSIVFVSSDMSVVSSCVLAITTLIRPFVWPNILVPILPAKLIDLIESPVPILAGIVGEPVYSKRTANVIWVALDDSQSTRRVHGNTTLVNEVVEFHGTEIREKLKKLHFLLFQEKTASFLPSPEHKRVVLEFARTLKSYWKRALEMSMLPSEQLVHQKIADGLSAPEDREFYKSFCRTQTFTNSN